ncbi:hypothetical protein EV1_001315 [Malus domestica]
MFAEAFRALNVAEHLLDRSIAPLISFSGDIVQPLGIIHLPFTIGSCPYTATITTNFLVVDCPTTYNVIFGRKCINDLKAMVSTNMLLMKFPTPYGNGYIIGDQLSTRSCYNTSVKQQHLPVPKETLCINDQQAQPAEELEKVSISKDYPDRMDMLDISPDIICHRLSIDPKTKLVIQKRKSYDAERYDAMKAEVEKLKGIGFVREVNYPTWVANVVLVKKNSTKENLMLQKVLWRIYVDYTDLNKGCPKDSFPLPLIDRLIDSTARCELLSFMDAYSGYNQILINPSDQEHTAFTTDRGLYCYNIGKSMEVYVDNMLVKSKHVDQHITNLSETFTILKRYRMRLNPNKCAFGVGSGKFLGFMISQRGIEANPEKIKAIIDMKEPVTSKDIQNLTGKVAALTRFISKATDRCAHFFKALKESKKYFTWTDECAKAFKNLKDYMSQAHLLSKPEILQSPDTFGRMIKWAITLGEFDISYQPKPAEKGHVVADFIADFTYPVDIVSTPKEVGCGAGLILTTHDKVAMEYAIRFKFKASNNEAEYKALLAGLRLAKHLGVTNNFDAKDSSMAAYLAQTQLLLKHFHYQIIQIPRAANSHADALARLASVAEDKIRRKIQVELLAAPSTMAAEVCNLQQGDSRITPIYRFLAHGILPNDKVQAKQIQYKATHYLIINDQLYKRGFNLPYLRCLTLTAAEIVFWEIHEGVCGDHAGSRSLAYKAFRQGYYWPTLHQDAIKISRSCDKCQRYATIPHSLPEPLTPMISPWPFA